MQRLLYRKSFQQVTKSFQQVTKSFQQVTKSLTRNHHYPLITTILYRKPFQQVTQKLTRNHHYPLITTRNAYHTPNSDKHYNDYYIRKPNISNPYNIITSYKPKCHEAYSLQHYHPSPKSKPKTLNSSDDSKLRMKSMEHILLKHRHITDSVVIGLTPKYGENTKQIYAFISVDNINDENNNHMLLEKLYTIYHHIDIKIFEMECIPKDIHKLVKFALEDFTEENETFMWHSFI